MVIAGPQIDQRFFPRFGALAEGVRPSKRTISDHFSRNTPSLPRWTRGGSMPIAGNSPSYHPRWRAVAGRPAHLSDSAMFSQSRGLGKWSASIPAVHWEHLGSRLPQSVQSLPVSSWSSSSRSCLNGRSTNFSKANKTTLATMRHPPGYKSRHETARPFPRSEARTHITPMKRASQGLIRSLSSRRSN